MARLSILGSVMGIEPVALESGVGPLGGTPGCPPGFVPRRHAVGGGSHVGQLPGEASQRVV
jgi:hypothetical protein